ncbi:hypothetical protein DUP91_25225 [Salmonella enterica subsp. enterica]|nr:hypothetical protein [Salmonella enterica subsp. enterica]
MPDPPWSRSGPALPVMSSAKLLPTNSTAAPSEVPIDESRSPAALKVATNVEMDSLSALIIFVVSVFTLPLSKNSVVT